MAKSEGKADNRRKALRENLARRKVQNRALKAGTGDEAGDAGPDGLAVRKRKLQGILKKPRSGGPDSDGGS